MAGDTGGDLLAKLQRYAGREFVFTSPDPIGAAPIRQYALSVGDDNPLYRDAEFARDHGLRDVVAPPTLVPDTWAYFGGDMDERGELLGRAELRELSGLRAGNEYEFFQPVHPDDVITATWKVGEAVERTGRAGRTIFQEFEARFTNQRGELLAISRETMFHPVQA